MGRYELLVHVSTRSQGVASRVAAHTRRSVNVMRWPFSVQIFQGRVGDSVGEYDRMR